MPSHATPVPGGARSLLASSLALALAIPALAIPALAVPALLIPAHATPTTPTPTTSTTTPTPTTSTPAPAPGTQRPDFDGDGHLDLAMGASEAVTVLYSVDSSFAPSATTEVLSPPTGTQGMGNVLATGDFDGDGYDDLAVGAPLSDTSAGRVLVYRGGPEGLVDSGGSATPQEIRAGLAGVPGTADAGDQFGHTLAVGNLTGAAEDDLIIGAPYDRIAGRVGAGSVTVVPGSSAGPNTAQAQTFTQNTAGLAGVAEKDDAFGTSLAVVDVTGDGWLDLAVGVPGENSRGVVQLLPGSASGLTGAGSSYVSAAALGLKPSPMSAFEPGLKGSGALFGRSLAGVDITRDGHADLVVGAFLARVADVPGCGAVAVLTGGSLGIAASRATLWSPARKGVAGGCAKSGFWGMSLTAGDLTGDGNAEIVVGAPYAKVGRQSHAGSYTVLRSSTRGVTATNSFVVTQNSPGVPGVAEAADYFGYSLALHDLNADNRLDVLAAAPFERTGSQLTGYVAHLPSISGGRPGTPARVLTGAGFPGETLVQLLGISLTGTQAPPAAVG